VRSKASPDPYVRRHTFATKFVAVAKDYAIFKRPRSYQAPTG
jgi:hypothetical protein